MRAKRIAITEQFLESFFMPQRRKFEDDIEWYQTHWPIKDSDYEKEPVTVDHIYAFGETVSQKKIA